MACACIKAVSITGTDGTPTPWAYDATLVTISVNQILDQTKAAAPDTNVVDGQVCHVLAPESAVVSNIDGGTLTLPINEVVTLVRIDGVWRVS